MADHEFSGFGSSTEDDGLLADLGIEFEVLPSQSPPSSSRSKKITENSPRPFSGFAEYSQSHSPVEQKMVVAAHGGAGSGMPAQPADELVETLVNASPSGLSNTTNLASITTVSSDSDAAMLKSPSALAMPDSPRRQKTELMHVSWNPNLIQPSSNSSPPPPPRKVNSVETDDPSAYIGDISEDVVSRIVSGDIKRIVVQRLKATPEQLLEQFFNALGRLPIDIEDSSLSLELNELVAPDGAIIAEGLRMTTHLCQLNLAYNDLGGQGIEDLRLHLLSDLKVLSLKANGIGGIGIKALGRTLSSLANLRVLDLQHNQLGNAPPRDISESLAGSIEGMTKLEVLDLRFNSFGQEESVALASIIGGLPALQHLALGPAQGVIKVDWNDGHALHISGTTRYNVLAILQHLPRRENVVAIDLNGNKLGPELALEVGHTLSQFPQLAHLSLEDNRLGPKGADIFSAALASVAKLESLDLGRNKSSSIVLLAERMPFLSRLDLRRNRFDTSSLTRALVSFSQLKLLIISGNNLSKADVQVVKSVLPKQCHVEMTAMDIP